MSSALGEKVRRHREALGLTLEQLASKIDSTKSYVWELENKPVARPSAEKVFRLAKALEVTAEYLMDDKRTESTTDERDKIFFRKFESLDDKDKDVLRRFVDSFQKCPLKHAVKLQA